MPISKWLGYDDLVSWDRGMLKYNDFVQGLNALKGVPYYRESSSHSMWNVSVCLYCLIFCSQNMKMTQTDQADLFRGHCFRGPAPLAENRQHGLSPINPGTHFCPSESNGDPSSNETSSSSLRFPPAQIVTVSALPLPNNEYFYGQTPTLQSP